MSPKLYLGVLACVLIAVLSGCGGDQTPVAPGDEEAVPAAPVKETEATEAPAPSETPAAAAVASDADPLLQQLIGTTWTAGEYTVNFVDESKVKLQGGKLKDLFPQGMDALFTFEPNADGAATISVSALGQTTSGTWDGTNLVIDGEVAVKN